MIRYNRMMGKSTLWIPGTDHAAIATQSVVEKNLQKKGYKRPREELGREKLIEEIKAFVSSSKDTIKNQIRKMGASCDWSREKYTLDDDLNVAVIKMFGYMFDDGLIYRGNRIVNWDPKMQTTVADDEVEYNESKSKFYYFQYGPVVIGTARPETKFLDKVIVVHPDDKRYQDIIGKEFELDWIDGKINATVIADSCIDMELGTGAMTITPAHSLIDFELSEKHNLEVEQIIGFDGKILHSVSKDFGGMTILEAREEIVKRLDKKGLLVKIDENYINTKAVNYRGKGVLEPQVMKQWFIDVNKEVIDWKGQKQSIKQVLQDVVRSGMIKIVPERFSKTYFSWIDNLRDWCISRQIWWGHQFPIWYKLDESTFDKFNSLENQTSFNLQKLGGELEIKFSVEKPQESGFWVRDPDTLDTWFSSALWTFSTLGWPDDTIDLKKFHPSSVLETGYDIIFFWVARMILASTYCLRKDGLSEEDSVPFKTIYLHGMIRDRNGKKMSKSNPETCIDPLDMISKYGADALRLSLLIGSSPGNDIRLYEDKIAGYRNFINKIWNISRYVLSTTEGNNKKDLENIKPITASDYWILEKLNRVIEEVSKNLHDHLFSHAGETIYNFLWNEFADWYIEVSKIEGKKDAILRYVLSKSMLLLHPFVPFVTEYIWDLASFSDKKLIVESWPEVSEYPNKELVKEFDLLKMLISQIRSRRADFEIEPKEMIDIVVNNEHLIKDTKLLSKLARVSNIELNKSYTPAQGDILISIDKYVVYLKLGDKIDVEKISKKLNKEIDDCKNGIKIAESKLANKNFVANAPKNVIESVKDNLSTLNERIHRLEVRLEQL